MPAAPVPVLGDEEIARNRRNQTKVVLEGRRPGLELEDEQGHAIGLKEYGLKLFDELAEVAALLDRCCGRNRYRETLAMHREKLLNPELTYSARLLKQLLESGQDNGCFGDELANRYREEMLAGELQYWDEAYFAGEAATRWPSSGNASAATACRSTTSWPITSGPARPGLTTGNKKSRS